MTSIVGLARCAGRPVLGPALLVCLPLQAGWAQSLASRVADAPDGTVRMSYTARPGVCGCGGRSITIRRTAEWESDCEAGPVRVALDVREGRVAAVDTYVGGRWRAAAGSVTDLGRVPAPAAADYLLSLAARLPGEAGEDAILPATLADSATTAPTLLAIARDDARPRRTRRAAVFWLGQAAADAATAGLESIARDASEEREVREHAVFALSQRPRDEGVPALIRIARGHADPELREKAIFWLAQSEDPRALDLFEELLLRH